MSSQPRRSGSCATRSRKARAWTSRWSRRLRRSSRATPSAIRLASDAFAEVFGRPPLIVRAGGTLPILAALARREIPTVMAGLALPDSHTHSPNERMLLETFPLGVAAARETYSALASL